MAAFMHVPVPVLRRERHFRDKNGLSLDFTDDEFRQWYRFSREGIMYLSDLLREDLQRQTNRNHALTVQQQVMVALRFYASGSFLQVIGDTLGLDKGTVYRIVASVSNALCRKRVDFIRWPQVNETRDEFYDISGFPNVLGAIDGTHVRIEAPKDDEPSYVNRKMFHSVNVQAVSDAKGKFTNLNASWPGSCHDAHIFRTSQVCTHLEENGGWQNGVLLGDSGYPCRPFLLTPFLNPQQQHHINYNRCHAATRSVIERTFGRWKRRFHVLHSEIRMAPGKACRIIVACAVLHNIALSLNEPDIEYNLDDLNHVEQDVFNGAQDRRGIREHVARTYFFMK